MSVSSTARKQSFVLNGVTSTFTFTFRALTSAPTDIKCKKTVSDVESALVYTTDYTVAVNSSGVGGVVTLVNAAAVGSGTLTVYRETTNTQASDYADYSQFPADTLETDLDIRTLVSQEQSEGLDRTLKLPLSYAGAASTELPTPSADKVLGWNSAATALENKTFTPATSYEKSTATDSTTGTNDVKYMTPTQTTIAIATFGSRTYTGTFGNTTLSSGVLVITHNKALSDPYAIEIVIFDNNDKKVWPDDVLGSANKAEVDLTSYGTLSGTWGYRYL